MPAADPCDSEILLVSAVHGTTFLGIVTEVAFSYVQQNVKIRGEGVTGNTCIAPYATAFMASVRFLVGPPIAVGAAAASLVFTVKQMDGGTRTYTITTTKPTEGYEYRFNRDSAPAEWVQGFEHVGSMATDPQSQS